MAWIVQVESLLLKSHLFKGSTEQTEELFSLCCLECLKTTRMSMVRGAKCAGGGVRTAKEALG